MRIGNYAGQREVAIRGGLLPHFMLGILRADLKEFVVSPHLLAMPDADLPSLPERGIYVDQEDFNDEIKLSNYRRYADLRNHEYSGFSFD